MERTKTLYTFFFSLLLLIFVTGCSQTTSSEEYLSKAKKHHQAGEISSAVVELKNALQQEPGNIEARKLLGLIYLDLGDGASAEKELSRAVDLQGEVGALAAPILRAKLIQEKFKDVVDDSENIFHLEKSEQAQILALRGNALLGMQEIDLARDAFDYALSLVPDQDDAGLGKAKIAAFRQQTETARKWISDILERSPQFAPAWGLLGDIERYQKNAAEAEEAYSKAISNRRDSAPDIYKRAQVRIYAGKFDEAQSDLQAVKRLVRSDLVAYSEGLILFQRKKFDQALTQFQAAVAGKYMPAIFYLGFTHYVLGNYGQAEQNLKEYLAHYQSDVATRLLAESRIALGDIKGAKSVLTRLLSRNPNDVDALRTLGQISLRQGEFDEGIDYLKDIVELDPESADAYMQLGLGLESSGDYEQGVKLLEQAATSGEHNLQAELAVILAHMRAGEFERAIKAAERSIENNPNDPDFWTLLGGARTAIGDADGARDAFKSAIEISPLATSAANNLALLEVKEGNIEAARAVYLEVLKQDPDDLTTLLNLAQLEVRQGNAERMVELLVQATKDHPESVRPRTILARYYLTVGQPTRVIELLNGLDPKQANHPSVLGVLGEAQMAVQQPEKAAVSFLELVRVIPNSAHAHYQLARAYSASNRVDLSRRELERALELDSNHYGSNYAMVRLLAEENRMDDANALYSKMTSTYSGIPSQMALGGWLEMKQGNSKAAIKTFKEVLANAPSSEITIFLARAQLLDRDFAGAQETLGNWLKDRPLDSSVQYELANTNLIIGELKFAADAFERFLELVPDHGLALNNLAWLMREENPEKAVKLAERALELDKDNPFILDTLGEVLLANGQLEDAIKTFERAVNIVPENLNISFHLAEALAKNNEVEKSKVILSRLLQSPEDFKHRASAQELLKSL